MTALTTKITIVGPVSTNSITRDLALTFSLRLHLAMGEDAWDEMVALNATPDFQAGACASHNYCDANEHMLQAFRDVTGKQPDPGDQMDADFINDAWAIARRIWSAMT